MSCLGSVILFNLSDHVYFLQVFPFVICSFRLSHGGNGLRWKRNKKYWLNILVWSLYCVREVSGKDGEGLEKKKKQKHCLQKTLSPFSWPLIKSKIHLLARQTDQSRKASVLLTQLWNGGISVGCLEHLKETSHGMVLLDPLPFSNILFIFCIEVQNTGVQSWTRSVMPQITSLLCFEAMTIH